MTQVTVSEALRKRRAWKSFAPGVTMDDATLAALVETALLTPTSYNLQHYRLVAVREPAQREALCAAAYHQRGVAEAACVVVIAADPAAWRQAAARWPHIPEGRRDRVAHSVDGVYGSDAALAHDEAIRSGSMLAMSLMLVAEERGWQSCPYIGFSASAVAAVVDLPADWMVVLLVALGRAAPSARDRPPRLDVASVLCHERWHKAAGQTPGEEADPGA